MSYCVMTVTAGNTVEIKKYHTRNQRIKGSTRRKKSAPTSEAREKANLKWCEERLRWLFATNFKGGDLSCTLSYSLENGCKIRTPEEMNKDITRFLRVMRAEYKKQGKELKFIYVPEIGSKGSRHFHITVNYIDINIIQKCWYHGFVRATPLDNSGNYKKLASYYIKYSEKTFRTEGRLSGKRYSRSRNLKEPIIKKQIITRSNTFRRNAEIPKGYYLDKESEYTGFDIYGHEFYRYICVKVQPIGRFKSPLNSPSTMISLRQEIVC